MKKIFGNIFGLKADQIHRLEYLYRHMVPTESLINLELALEISSLSREIRLQIGLLIDRQGKITHVIVGDQQKIIIPDISEYRTIPGRLKGLRCVHTHLKNEALTQDDLTDLALLRLDMMAAITVTQDGLPYQVHAGHIMPESSEGAAPYQILPAMNPDQLSDMESLSLIKALDDELANIRALYDSGSGKERAFLVSVTTSPRRIAEESVAELEELAISGGIEVAEKIFQQRKEVDSRFLIGSGKLKELTIMALQKGITLLIFDQELNSSQIRSITDQTDLKVIDRTQLILDIFAQRAQTREGKLQVELAQLKYMLPRLVTKNTAMSRLTGGIGGRGPGETKLEINRRRARDRINQLGKELELVRKHRKQQRIQRTKKGLPVISIIGYTNAGKSTLLNTLTKSHVLAESRLFATLDPSSRRLRFPKDTEVIITDTVGFIRDLPKDLMTAFRATLEELESADLLLHVIDISNPRFENQIESVERILSDLHLNQTATIRVLNKQDLVEKELCERLCMVLDGTAVSANNRKTLMPLIEKMEAIISEQLNSTPS